jgi:hypothetical protein
MTNDLRILRCNQPINSRTRITGAQFYQHGDRMHYVAERRRFDQQNARELGSLQRGSAVRNLCVLYLRVQFAKDRSARVMPLLKLRNATRRSGAPGRWRSLFSVNQELLETARRRADLPCRTSHAGFIRDEGVASSSLVTSDLRFVLMPPFFRPITRHGFFSSTPRTDGGFAHDALPPRW